MGEMTRAEKLKWLARELKEWKGGCEFCVVNVGHEDVYVTWPINCSPSPSSFKKYEWKTAREEWQQAKPAQDNSWHERGELPQVGVPVELWFGGAYAYDCEFIGKRGSACILWNLDADRPDCADLMNSEFRPLRTEREKAIDEMKSLCAYPGSWNSTYKSFAEALYDAGYRKEKNK